MGRPEDTAGDVIALQVDGLRGLSRGAARFVRRHPAEARLAVTAALEAAAVQFETRHKGDDPSMPGPLKPFLRSGPTDDDMISVAAAAERLRVSRTTVYDWIAKKQMIAWKTTKRGTVVPAAQIIGPGELVPGLDRVLAIIPDGRAAWRFLSEPSPYFDRRRRPIDVLKRSGIDAVTAAAQAQGEAFT